jgi:Fuc2NAc and GlcNAc transferase
MASNSVLAAMAALVGSALLTGLMRRLALSGGVLDVPNARSSHSVATPRGGGVAIVLAVTSGLVVLAVRVSLQIHLLIALVAGGLAVATVGFLDDRRPLPSSTRLAVHFAAAVWALTWLGGIPPLRVASEIVSFGWGGYLLGAFGIVWALNLFNFMDGIDGIAASEALFIAASGSLLTSSAGVSAVGLVLAAACAGFLLWNWPPAKIFMGDVGSGYLGYVIAVLAIAAAQENSTTLWVWLILGGVFFVDATVTLVRRALRRDRLYEAHRSHAYQWLARRWVSHGRVTIIVMVVNLFWLLPCAYFAAQHPGWAAWLAIAALMPLILASIAVGSGRREPPSGTGPV